MKRLAGVLGLSVLLLTGCATEGGGSSSSTTPTTPAPRPRPATPPRPRTTTTSPSTNPSPGGVPIANPDEQDSIPHGDEIPANVGSVPDAVPQSEQKSQYGNPSSYEVYGKRYEIVDDPRGFRERGYASWYGKKFHGKRTSSGAPYDMFAMTAAHKTLPIPCYARITNTSNGKSVIVKINDRGPFHDGRIIDLSYAAATRLDMLGHGSVLVDLEVITPGDIADTVVATAEPSKSAEVAAAKPPTQTEKPPVVVAQPAVALRPGAPRYLQAGLFGDAVNAAAFREKLAASGIKPLLMKSESRNSRWVYRVLIGPFEDMGKLNAERTRLSAGSTPTIPVVD